MVERVEELKSPPIVGVVYLVPCVRREGAWLPVTGPRHEDRDIVKFDFEHWHYDFRFVPTKVFRSMTWEGARAPHGCVLITDDGAGKRLPDVGSQVEYRRMKCRREAPAYPTERAETRWLVGLRDAYADKRVKCGKCPHRGLPLESLPREPGTDIVTCPGHGLRWDLKTGELVR